MNTFRYSRLAIGLFTIALFLPTACSAADLFQFRNGFWINLHHYLYAEALAQGTNVNPRWQASARAALEHAPCSAFAADEQRDWNEVVKLYEQSFSSRDPLFDQELLAVNRALGSADDRGSAPISISNPLRGQLQRAADAYRAHCWPAHQRANALWIAALGPRLADHGTPIAKRLSEVYGEPWPNIVVDVVTYSNWAGAYTADHQITVDSLNPDYQGDSALEMIFHEASHTIDDGIIKQLSAAFRKLNSDQPNGFEHALIFFTAGALTQTELRSSDPEYVPYAYRLGIYKRVPFWAEDEQLFQQYWQPYLQGKHSRQAAIESMARAIVGEDTKASGTRTADDEVAAAIRAVLDDQVSAWNRGDLDAFMRGYAKLPELSFYSGATVTSGWEQTLQRYRTKYQGAGNQMGKLVFSDLEIHVLAPDAAWVGGRWQLEMTDGKRPGGLFTLIFRKLPEGWRIVHDHTSS